MPIDGTAYLKASDGTLVPLSRVGPQGPQGPEGPRGPEGPAGTGVTIKGSLASTANLPATGVPGDAYLISGNLHVWTGTAWQDVGSIQGPKGDPGETGPQGPAGTQGPAGSTGPQGIQGPKGDPGDDGAPGSQGPKGDKGDPGEQGIQGIQGPVGPAGPQGDPGADGADGADGAQGIQGPKGDPGEQGPIGPAGPKGDKGDPGDPGAQGPVGPAGPAGPLDILTDVTAPANTPVGKVLGTTAVGAWGPVDPPAGGGGGPSPATTNPVSVSGQSSSVGTSLDYARADHRHTIQFAAPVALGPAISAGTSTALARADHVHPVPALDALPDVDAPADTPAGKVLGTTATGQWGPVDPPAGSSSGVLTVIDYGAVGDGVADDTAAIQAAIDSGDTVRFPPGVYKVSRSGVRPVNPTYHPEVEVKYALKISSSTSIVGSGAGSTKIVLSGGTGWCDVLFAQDADVSVSGITIDADITANPFNPTGMETTNIQFWDCPSVRIRDCVFTGATSEGCYLLRCNWFHVGNVESHHNGLPGDGASGIHIDTCNGGTVSGNRLHDNGFHGLLITNSRDVVVDRLIARDNWWNGVMVQVGSTGIHMNNLVLEATKNIAAASGGSPRPAQFRGINLRTNSKDIEIHGAVMHGHASTGLCLLGDASTGDVVERVRMSDAYIAGSGEWAVQVGGNPWETFTTTDGAWIADVVNEGDGIGRSYVHPGCTLVDVSADAPAGGGGGITQAQADARYVNLDGDAMTGALAVPSIGNGDNDLALTSSLNANGHTFYGVAEPRNADHAATKGYVDSRGGTEVWEGTRAQYDAIASKDPAVLYVITDVPAAIGGHARGDIGSLAVPSATATRITTLSSTNNAGVVVTNSNIKLIEAGYWSITVHLNGLLQAANQRSFISFIVNNNVLARFPAGSPGEAMATASATIYFTANRLLEFDCYTAGAATTVTGKFYIKYLGAT